MVLLAMAPLVISRTEYPNLISWQSAVYFMGAYSLGMLAGEHYERMKALISQYRMPLWVIVVISSIGVFYLIHAQYEPRGAYSLKQTFVYLQKMSAAALFIDYLSAREEKPSKFLKVLGSHSFPIYFLHAYFAFLIADAVTAYEVFESNAINIAWLGASTYTAVILLSLTISMLLKKLLGGYSRNIIGS